MCNPLKNISFKVPLFETGKKKVGPGLPMPWHNRTPTRISLPVPCRRLPPPQRLRAADRDNEPLSDVAEAPGQREEPEKPIRPPPEHPRAKAQPGRGGPLVCPALREWDRRGGAGPPAPQGPGWLGRAGSRPRRLSSAGSHVPRGSPPQQPSPPGPRSSLHPGPAPPAPRRTELGAAAYRSPRASRARG